jgi:hypothetical protein
MDSNRSMDIVDPGDIDKNTIEYSEKGEALSLIEIKQIVAPK